MLQQNKILVEGNFKKTKMLDKVEESSARAILFNAFDERSSLLLHTIDDKNRIGSMSISKPDVSSCMEIDVNWGSLNAS